MFDFLLGQVLNNLTLRHTCRVLLTRAFSVRGTYVIYKKTMVFYQAFNEYSEPILQKYRLIFMFLFAGIKKDASTSYVTLRFITVYIIYGFWSR